MNVMENALKESFLVMAFAAQGIYFVWKVVSNLVKLIPAKLGSSRQIY
jgi:hypothetical protein